jgi:hypothetical protein
MAAKPNSRLAQSSDIGIHGAGKGDRPRNMGKQFAENYDAIAWSPRVPRPGRIVTRYGSSREHKSLNHFLYDSSPD